MEVSAAGIALGLIIGLTYGMLAVTLCLVYRSSRLINFAQGEIGALGATFLALAVLRWHIPYWVALLLAMAVSAGGAALVEAIVGRRLRKAPRVMGIIATLGAAQFLLLFSASIGSSLTGSGFSYPSPPGLPEFDIGSLRVTQAYSGMLILMPIALGVLIYFLRRSRFGLGIRAAADDDQVARLAGVPAARMSMIAWMVAGALAALSAVLVFPTRGLNPAESLGPALLLRGLAPAVIARMTDLRVAFAAGVVLGVVEVTVNLNTTSGGYVELVLFAVILGTLLTQRRTRARGEESGSWTAVEPWPPLPKRARRVWLLRHAGSLGLVLLGTLGVLIALFGTNRTAAVFVSIFGLAIVGISVGVVTGLSGQLSLGQLAIAAIGATVSYHVTYNTGNFVLGFGGALLVGALASTAIGIPALRIKGLMLAVTTLSFALMAQSWLLPQPWMLGGGVRPGRPIIGSFMFDTGRRYYMLGLGVMLVAMLLYRNLKRSGLGRVLVALRDNEDAARACGIPAIRRKIQAFAIAGAFAGIGGALYGHSFASISMSTFPARASIDVAAMAVLGGLGIVAGPLLGALYIVGIPAFVPLDSAGLAASSLGWLILILYFPGGLAQLLRPLRDRFVTAIARVAVTEAPPEDALPRPSLLLSAPDGQLTQPPSVEFILECCELRKAYGGVHAVDDVTLRMRSNEILGIIGPNGAGKTTLFEVLSGFTAPDAGRVVYLGRDVTKAVAEERARRGLVRSFQASTLFPTLTVTESVLVALERAKPTGVASAMLSLSRSERKKEQRAHDIVESLGLGHWADLQVRELSTGTRRVAELACLVALEPKLLLLDEPSAGIAQREAEALGPLLVMIKDYLGATLAVIEHDLPLLSSFADRFIAMESGRIIADGSPEEVRHDPAVLESYLGGYAPAIDRSGEISNGGASKTRRRSKAGVRKTTRGRS